MGFNIAFPTDSILPLVGNETFSFEEPENIVAWRFQRDFYCIVTQDKEVGCAGFLFYGSAQKMFIRLSEDEQQRLGRLCEVFKDEFAVADNVQGEMLRMLLVRLVILLTRHAKDQFLDEEKISEEKLDIVRQFNVLVEFHFREEHKVSYYAEQLFKSPKTLSNLFALYNDRSPLQVIQDRLILEARRLFTYTDKSVKEVAIELGYQDASHFSRFFKKQLGKSPLDFKKSLEI